MYINEYAGIIDNCINYVQLLGLAWLEYGTNNGSNIYTCDVSVSFTGITAREAVQMSTEFAHFHVPHT